MVLTISEWEWTLILTVIRWVLGWWWSSNVLLTFPTPNSALGIVITSTVTMTAFSTSITTTSLWRTRSLVFRHFTKNNILFILSFKLTLKLKFKTMITIQAFKHKPWAPKANLEKKWPSLILSSNHFYKMKCQFFYKLVGNFQYLYLIFKIFADIYQYLKT